MVDTKGGGKGHLIAASKNVVLAKPSKRLLGGHVNEKRLAQVESITEEVLAELCRCV